MKPDSIGTLLNIAHIAKLDLLLIREDELEDCVKVIRQYDVKLLAE